MLFLFPCSMMANLTATTPATLPCSGPKVGACGGVVEGVRGLGAPVSWRAPALGVLAMPWQC